MYFDLGKILIVLFTNFNVKILKAPTTPDFIVKNKNFARIKIYFKLTFCYIAN